MDFVRPELRTNKENGNMISLFEKANTTVAIQGLIRRIWTNRRPEIMSDPKLKIDLGIRIVQCAKGIKDINAVYVLTSDLSRNPNVTFEDYLNSKDEIQWDQLSLITKGNMTIRDVISYPWFFEHYMYHVSSTYLLTIDDVLQHPEVKWNFYALSQNKHISLSKILANPKLPWNINCICYKKGFNLELVKNNVEFPWEWDTIYVYLVSRGSYQDIDYAIKKVKSLGLKIKPGRLITNLGIRYGCYLDDKNGTFLCEPRYTKKVNVSKDGWKEELIWKTVLKDIEDNVHVRYQFDAEEIEDYTVGAMAVGNLPGEL